MKNSPFLLFAVLVTSCLALPAFGAPFAGTEKGLTGGGPTIWNRQAYAGALRPMQGDAPEDQGGRARTVNQEQPTEDRGLDEVSGGKCTVADAQCNVPASAIRVNWPAGLREAFKRSSANADGRLPTNAEMQLYLANFVANLAAGVNAPDKQMHAAKSNLDSQAMEMANALADLEKQQAASAIDFCSSFLVNFTVDGGNKWNRLRDGIFVPMAILLLLPGAMLTQVKSIVAAGNPVLGEANPFEGIQRAIIAIFLIPGTYLVLNYSIDLNNSITHSIADEYTQVFGTDMYRDAISFHIRAFPARQPGENRNALDQQTARMGPLLNGTTAFARFEGMMIENKIEDPIAGIYLAPPDRADEALPASVIAAKEMFNSTNATFMIAWNILCAFQMIYFYYLWFVGPITAALWAWPMKQLRGAFPSWCEGVITLGFWSLFWNTSILLMACFRGVDETGTLVITALNFLATSSVKYAFDFAGLAKAAGQEAANMADKAMKASQKGGGGGGKSGGGGSKSHGHSGSRQAASGNEGSAHHAGVHRVASESSQPGSIRLASFDGSEGGGLLQNAVGAQGLLHNASFSSLSLETVQPTYAQSELSLPPSTVSFDPSVGKADPDAPVAARVDHIPPPTESGVTVIPPGAVLSFSPIDRDLASDPVKANNLSHHSLAINAGFGMANATGMHSTYVNDQPAVSLLPHHGLAVGADGSTFFAQNQEGDYVQIQFDADGRAVLPDGTVVQSTELDAGTELSIFGSGLDAAATDNFLIRNSGDELTIAHSDAQHCALDAIVLSSNAAGQIHAQAYDAHGRKTYSEDWNGSQIKTTNYDPQTQAVTGYGVVAPASGGGTLTSYYDRDSAPLGATLTQLGENGYYSAVYDAAGQVVSYERDSIFADSSFTNLTSIDTSYAASLPDVPSVGTISALANFAEYSNNVTCPVDSRYATAPGAETITLSRSSSSDAADYTSGAARNLAEATQSSSYQRSALDVGTSNVWATSGSVIPDANVFAASVPVQQQQSVCSYQSSGGTMTPLEYSRSSSSEISYTAPAPSGYIEPDRAVPYVSTSEIAERIAFDCSPTSYRPVDQSVEYSGAPSHRPVDQSVEYSGAPSHRPVDQSVEYSSAPSSYYSVDQSAYAGSQLASHYEHSADQSLTHVAYSSYANEQTAAYSLAAGEKYNTTYPTYPGEQTLKFTTPVTASYFKKGDSSEQIFANRKETALQPVNDTYKNELRKELISTYSSGSDVPVQIYAAAKSRTNPHAAPKSNPSGGLLNSLIDRSAKRSAPPIETRPSADSLQPVLSTPADRKQSVEVPTFLNRMKDATEHASSTSPIQTETTMAFQSLQEQMMTTTNHNLKSNLSSALGRANTTRLATPPLTEDSKSSAEANLVSNIWGI